jgi:hypothetical protein
MLTVAAAVILPATKVSAASAPAYWVSAGGATAHADTSCATAGYGTVQAAVTAAETYQSQHPGKVPVVDVCPGTYAEQVTITKSLTVTRAPVAASQGDATIKLPASVGKNQLTGLSPSATSPSRATGRAASATTACMTCWSRAAPRST